MSVYADSSALVKRYLDDEEDTTLIRELDAVVVSTLAAVEVSSAIWRRARMGALSAADAGYLSSTARGDLTGGDPAIVAVPPTLHVILEAGRLTGTAGLRAYDAIQLATAMLVRDADSDCNTFACYDHGLSAAAAAHGFDVVT